MKVSLISVFFLAVILLSTGTEGVPNRPVFSDLEKLLGFKAKDTLAGKRETAPHNTRAECGTLIGYARKAGRLPDLSPCPEGLRDDGISCWSDAHIYGKGCCCTLFGCCNNCDAGYHDDGCTCRKTDIGIKVTLGERWQCGADEELYAGLCYPKCDEGYYASGCCFCLPLC